MFLPKWHHRVAFSSTTRLTRRGRRKLQPTVQHLERRELLSITPTAVTVLPVETQLFQGTVASFTATDAGPFTASIDWGDGITTAGTVAARPSGGYNVGGAHTYAEDGTKAVAVSIIDGANSTTATAASTADVAEGTFILSSGPDINTKEGIALTGVQVATFNDPGSADSGSDFAATIDWGDGKTSAGTISGSGGNYTVTGNHTFADELNGNYLVTVSEPTANFTLGPISSSVTVADTDAGSLTTSAITATEGATFSGQLATLADAYTGQVAGDLTTTVDWGDGTTTAGILSGGSGTFTINGSHAYADEGTYTVTTKVADDAPGTFTATGTAVANVAEGDFGNLNPMTIAPTEGHTFSGAVASFTDPGNPLQTAGDFTAGIDWGDGTSTTGTVTGPTGGPFTISGSHAYSEDGSFMVVATFSDDPPSTLKDIPITSTAAVSEADLTVTAGAAMSATEGVVQTGITLATFSDPGSPDAASDFAATIDWGDGTTTMGTISGTGGSFTVLGDHTYADELNSSYTVTVSEPAANFTATAVSNSVRIAEGDSGTPISATIMPSEGTAFSGAVGTFTDNYTGQVAGDFSATIDWGDGKVTAGTVTGGSGMFTISGNHTYADEGQYAIRATFADDAPGSVAATITSSAVVYEADLTVSAGPAISATEGVALTGINVATFSDPGSPETATDFTATVDWGDGIRTIGTITGSAGNFAVAAGHTYAEDGIYPVAVTVTENGTTQQGSLPSATIFATVSESDATLTARSISVAEGQTFAGQIALLNDPGSSDPAAFYTVAINWGDGTTGLGNVIGSNGSFTVTGTHQYADDGHYTISLSASEGGAPPSPIATATGTADVSEDDITVTALAIQAGENQAFNGTIATFTDSTAAAGDLFTAVVNWGDGTSSTATVTAAAGIYTINGGHTYAEDGHYTVTVTVAENGVSQQGQAASATAMATVAENDATLTATSISIGEGKQFSGQIGLLTDPGSTDNGTAFNALVQWGDGSTSAATVSGAGGAYTLSGTHTYAEDGTYAVTLSASESPQSIIATVIGSANVAEDDITITPVPVHVVENSAFSGAVASFTDPTATAGDVFTAEINWGDGVVNAGTVTLTNGAFTISGTHTYGDDGQYSLGISVHEKGVNQAGGSQLASAVAMVVNASPQASWADNAFEDLLGREIEPGAITNFVAAQQAGVSRLDLARFITGSDEYLVNEIDRAYAEFLGRVADPAGRAFWLAQMRHGLAYEQLQAAFIASPEYYRHAGGTDRAWVDRMYFDLLGRQPDATGENYWVQALAGGESRFDVALGFTTSDERESIVIAEEYVNLLNRQGTPQEIAGWVGAYDRGLSNEEIAAEFVASDEYFHVEGQD